MTEQELPTDLISEANQQTGTRELTLAQESKQILVQRPTNRLEQESYQQILDQRLTNRPAQHS